MIGGFFWIAQWAREIEQKHKERAEQREASKRRHVHRSGGQELRHIKLSAAEKQKLQAKIAGQHRR